MSNAHIQAKLNQKLKLLQDKKKIVKNLKSLELFEKGVQEEIERITPEKRKFEEWTRYFGSEDAKTKQVLKWFNDELKKLNDKAERAHAMRTKILAVQEQIDLQIQHLNIELDQLRTESLRMPLPGNVEPSPKFPGREMNISHFPSNMDKSPLLPDEDETGSMPDSLLEEVLFSKPTENPPDWPSKITPESTQSNIFQQDDSTGIPVDHVRESQNIIENTLEESQHENTRSPETSLFHEQHTEESALPDHSSLSTRKADYLFQPPDSDNEKHDNFTDKPSDNSTILNVRNEQELSTDYIDTEAGLKFNAPTLNFRDEESVAVPKREEDTQQEIKNYRLFPPDKFDQTSAPERLHSDQQKVPVDDFVQRPLERLEQKEFQQPTIQNKRVESSIQVPKSTEFDEFEVFEKSLNRQRSFRSEDEHKINYIKNQPVRPVEEIPAAVQSKSEPQMRVAKEIQEFKTPTLPPEPPLKKTTSIPSDKKEQFFRQVAIEKEETIPARPKQVTESPKIPVPRLSRMDVLYLGIDLGTYETTVAASNGEIATTISAVGWPKDIVSQKMLRKDVLVGEEALRNKLALHFYRPLEHGVIKDTDADLKAAKELIKYAIKLIHPEKYKKVYAVIGAPAQAKLQNHQSILDAAREIIDAVTIVSEPFSVAYGEANIYNTLVIDIGAGTTDICRLRGTMPAEEDQISLIKAGDYIDNQLIQAISNRVKGAQVTKDMARRWKEAHSFVMQSLKPVVVEITVEGKPLRVDITSCIQKSCEAIVDDLVAASKSLISTFDPEFQTDLKQNILLAGGGSLIYNLDKLLALQMSNLGRILVKKVPNPIEAGARGALALAMDLTDDYWRGLVL